VGAAAGGKGEVRVRPAREADFPQIIGMLRALGTLQHPWRLFRVRAGLLADTADRYRRAVATPDGDALLLVAEADDRIVGTAFGLVVVPSSLSDEVAVELSGVFVRPSHRGRRIGAALTSEVARFARRRGIGIVVLKTFAENEGAFRFWERVGFRPRAVQMVASAERLASASASESP
jgi:GNAT superfamily N-acetyltransferase